MDVSILMFEHEWEHFLFNVYLIYSIPEKSQLTLIKYRWCI